MCYNIRFTPSCLSGVMITQLTEQGWPCIPRQISLFFLFLMYMCACGHRGVNGLIKLKKMSPMIDTNSFSTVQYSKLILACVNFGAGPATISTIIFYWNQ